MSNPSGAIPAAAIRGLLETRMPALHPETLTLASGIALSCAVQGNASDQAVILLHGLSDSWPSYRPLLERLPSGWRTVALTLRGHGDSGKPPAGYGTAEYAADVVAAMDALGIGSAAIVGHSLGSLIAQRIAMDHPERVLQLVLIGAFATLRGNAAVSALWDEVVADMSDPVAKSFVRAFQQSALTLPVAPDFFEGVVAESLKLPAHVWRGTLGTVRSENHTPRLGEIGAPTLILWGDQDAFADREEQERLAGSIQNARLVAYGGVGHSPHWEDPGRVAADLVAFLGQHNSRAA